MTNNGEKGEFAKYAKGAYHWREYHGSTLSGNVFLKERYNITLNLLKTLHATKTSHVLDVGCGDGALTGLVYHTFHCDVQGIDVTKAGIDLAKEEFAKKKFCGQFTLVEGYDYSSLSPAQFDFVLCSDVIEHVGQPGRLVEEMWRLVKAGGYAIVSTPIRLTEKPLSTLHVQEWFPDDFARFCACRMGKPFVHTMSHPVVFNELYSIYWSPIGGWIRFIINVLYGMGINTFSPEATKKWKFPTLQTLVFGPKEVGTGVEREGQREVPVRR